MRISFKLLLAGALIISAGQLSAAPLTLTQLKPAPAREERKVFEFDKFNLSAPCNYVIAMGPAESLQIEGSKSVLSRISTVVRNGTLIVSETKVNGAAIAPTEKITVYITTREISDVQLSGTGNVSFKNNVISSTLRLALSGSGNLTGKVNVATVDCKLNGSGSIKLSGIAENAKVKIAGSGNVIADALKADNTEVEVSGSGKAQIYTAKSLSAKVAGTGAVRYSGNPKKISKSNLGGGQIVRV